MLELPARYEDRHLLGEGGMGQVRLVLDRERGEELALKTLMPAPGADLDEARFLFKQEFWAMASLRHPNLVAAYDFGELATGTPYFTMELVPGQDVATDRASSEAEVRAWLPGVAAALGFLHGRGYVHGDLKPENVRVREDGAVKLMDLGLLTRAGRAGGAVRGTLLYLAPEVAKQAPLDGRADLYALGAVMYHALAGRPPFAGDSAIALLRAHLDATPPALRPFAPDVSRELESAVMRLLAKDPAERFASAAELLEALGMQTEMADAASLLGSPLVGREQVQAELANLVKAPSGGTRWLLGGPGSGKSRLLTEARANAQLDGLATFFTQGLGTDAAPYTALRPWLLALAARPSTTRDRLAPVLARLLPEMPVLCGQPDLEPAHALEGAQERMRLHGAVAELARAGAPDAVWLLDDADQLDAASRELLGFLQAQGAGQPWRWLLAAQTAPETVRALTLPPLDDAQALAMARAMLAQDELPDALVDRLPVLTAGLPGAVEAVLGHWTRTGALKREGGRWVAGPAEAFELPGGWQVALEGRLAELGDDARLVGKTAALLGVQADLTWLAALVPLDQSRFFAALAELEAAEVLAREGDGGMQFRFGRPAQAELLAASWDEADRKALHTRAADWLVARMPGPADRLTLPLADVGAAARHHLAGDTPLAGIPYATAFALRSLHMYVASGVGTLVRAALAVPGLPVAGRLKLQVVLGMVQRYDGQIDDALALYEEELVPALRETASPDLAQQLVTLGVIYQMKGRYPQALAALAEAINLADAANDLEAGIRARNFAGRVGFFAGETAAARTHLASAVRRSRDAGEKELLATALGLYGYVLASTEPGRMAEGLAALEEAIALNREIDNTYELHEALNNQGNVFLSNGRLAEARAVFEQCLLLCQKMGMANEALFGHLNLGAVQLDLGLFGPALAEGRRAGEMARQQGRKFPEGFALALEGLALVYTGELATGMERLERGLALAREIKNRYLELNVLVYHADACLHLGRFFDAESSLGKARELAEATHNDEQNGKLSRMETALAVVRGADDADARVTGLLAATREANQAAPLAHALRWQADRLLRAPGADERQRAERGQTALEALTEAARLAEGVGLVALGAEVEELWGRALASVDRAAAHAHFERGHGLAVASGGRLIDILCQAGLGATDPSERQHRQEAPRRLEALLAGAEPKERDGFLSYPERAAVLGGGVTDGPGYSADRLHHLVDLMASVSAQPDLGAVMNQALAALVEIAGADRGFLLLYKGFEVIQQVFQGMGEDDSDAYSSSLAYQILWSGEPVFIEDAQAHAEFGGRESVQALSLRSMVGVPLNDGTETLGVMLADSRRINTAFAAEDLDLCMALGRQVAIAISNARRLEQYKNGYEELAMLHRLALATLGESDVAAFMGPVGVEAARLCGADRALLLVGDDLRCLAAVDPAGRALASGGADVSSSVSRWVYEQGEPLHLLDAAHDEAFNSSKSVQALGLRTIYAAPVMHEGKALGVLYLDNTRMGDPNPQGLHALGRIGELVGAFLSRRG